MFYYYHYEKKFPELRLEEFYSCSQTMSPDNCFYLDLASPLLNFFAELHQAETSPIMLLTFTDTYLDLSLRSSFSCDNTRFSTRDKIEYWKTMLEEMVNTAWNI